LPPGYTNREIDLAAAIIAGSRNHSSDFCVLFRRSWHNEFNGNQNEMGKPGSAVSTGFSMVSGQPQNARKTRFGEQKSRF
jgi:hypothetical protein